MDWTLEALVPVVEGKLPLITTVDRDAGHPRRRRVRRSRQGEDRHQRRHRGRTCVAPLLKEKNVPVILGNVLSLPAREDAFHAATYQLAGELAKAGVKFAFSTGDNAYVAHRCRITPAMSVAWGLNRDDAIKALTINAAEILGVADRVGSLEPGKDANLFIAKGDPLEIRTQRHARLHQRQGRRRSTTSTSASTRSTSRRPVGRS